MAPPKDVQPRRRKILKSFSRVLQNWLLGGVPIPISSFIVEQRHETVVHVQLLVAVEKGQSWVVSSEVDFCFLIAAYHDHVFQNAGGRLPCDPGEFKGVAMQMDRVDVIT